MKILFKLLIPLLCLLSCTSFERTTSDEEWSFVCVGDIRQGYGIYEKLALHMARNTPQSSFAIHLGDISRENGKEAEWINFTRISKPITDVMPLWVIRGNHEGNDAISEYLFRKYTNRPTGTLYWQEQFRGFLFIYLDTEIPGEENSIQNEQLQWLRSLLSAAEANSEIKGIFISLHRPVYPQKHYKGINLGNADEVHVLFSEAPKIKGVFAGHEHSFDYYKKDGISYITTGGGGSPLHHGFGDDYFHYCKISFYNNDSTIILQSIDIFNEVLDEYTL